MMLKKIRRSIRLRVSRAFFTGMTLLSFYGAKKQVGVIRLIIRVAKMTKMNDNAEEIRCYEGNG